MRYYFAIGHEDRAKSEWTAIDAAAAFGRVSASPVKGIEPVQAVVALTPARMKRLGLAEREVRPLGKALPRRWL